MIFVAYVLVLWLVAFLYLFVCVDGNGGGFLARAKNFFWEEVPQSLKRFATAICGVVFVRLIERICRYIFYKRNPIVQIVYFICAFGGFYIYVKEGFKHIPNERVGEVHIYIGTAIMVACYGSYFMACYVNPGMLNKKTDKEEVKRALKRFKYDSVIFEKGLKCSTCENEKPARSKHCSMCGCCVEKLDHHCIWINQCVGLHNYKWFLSFLFLHAVICTYGVVVGFHIFMSLVDRENMMGVQYINTKGEKFNPSPFVVFTVLHQDHEWLMGVVILCLVVSFMLWLFLGYHLYLVYSGYTTNESSKSSSFGYFIKKTNEFFSNWEKMKTNDPKAKPNKETLEQFEVESTLTLKEISKMRKETQKELTILKKGSIWAPETLLKGLQ